MCIIEVDHITKSFQLGELESLRTAVGNQWRRLRGQPIEHRMMFSALQDVSFSVKTGEVLGIIGHNGAGKSTLLKLLSGISKPTSGRITVRGRIAPLIEVGAGFIGQLTGRENVYLNGSILGMSKREIDRKFEEIVAFSELEEFIDTPVKRYSSGMRVKLAFSVATSISADILIVDEVLAVGDIAFQRKCIARMEDFIRSEGHTVLIVGHNIRQLERICSRMLLLKHGRIELDGSPGQVSKRFLDETTLKITNAKPYSSSGTAHQSGDVLIENIEVVSGHKNVDGVPQCQLFSELKIVIEMISQSDHPNAEINLGLHNPEMIFVTKTSTSLSRLPVNLRKGRNTIEVTYPHLCITPGTYAIGFAVYDWARQPLWSANSIIWLNIEATAEDTPLLPASTLTYLPAQWNIQHGENLRTDPVAVST